jgi:hypothetical protein
MRLKPTIFLYINALLPFIHHMRDYFNGRIFKGFYYFTRDYRRYARADSLAQSGFPISLAGSFPCLIDRFESAGAPPRHYFYQDLWGARKVFDSNAKIHYDIGSRLDGFIGHCLPFCEVVMLDIRPLDLKIHNLKFMQVDCTNMCQIPNQSVSSLSSFHAIEHFGLGRYGDGINPLAHKIAIDEMRRIVSTNGSIYFGAPIGKQRLEFNAHRIFDPMEIVKLFKGFELLEFSVIDDEDNFHEKVEFENYSHLDYGCGLFHFKKNEMV